MTDWIKQAAEEINRNGLKSAEGLTLTGTFAELIERHYRAAMPTDEAGEIRARSVRQIR